MLNHEFESKASNIKLSGARLEEKGGKEATRKLGSEAHRVGRGVMDILVSERFYNAVQSRLLAGSRRVELPSEAREKLTKHFQELEELRERAFKAYQREKGVDKEQLQSIHHDAAALANSLQHLVLVKGKRNVTGADIREMTRDTLRRKFRGLRARATVTRSVPNNRAFRVSRGDLFLIIDNAKENAEKATRLVGGSIESKIIQRRDGTVVIRVKSLGTLDEEKFLAQRRFYRGSSREAVDLPIGSGTGIVGAFTEILGGKCTVWRRKGPRGLHYYYFTVELPNMAMKAAA